MAPQKLQDQVVHHCLLRGTRMVSGRRWGVNPHCLGCGHWTRRNSASFQQCPRNKVSPHTESHHRPPSHSDRHRKYKQIYFRGHELNRFTSVGKMRMDFWPHQFSSSTFIRSKFGLTRLMRISYIGQTHPKNIRPLVALTGQNTRNVGGGKHK